MAFAFNDDRSKLDITDLLKDAFDLSKAEGVLDESHGGTGQTSLRNVRAAMGLGSNTGALSIANGGTGATSAAGARNALGLGNTTGALPIANGGTGATTADAAREALGAAPRWLATEEEEGLMSAGDKAAMKRMRGIDKTLYNSGHAGFGYQNASKDYWLYFPIHQITTSYMKVGIGGTGTFAITGGGKTDSVSVAASKITATLRNGGALLELHFTGSAEFSGGTRQPLYVWLTGLEIEIGDSRFW